MRMIGLDLAITGSHKAVVMDQAGKYVTPVFALHTWPDELAAMLKRAREGAADDEPVAVVMEPTGLAWLPVAVYLLLHQVTVYLVNSQQVADLRRYYKKHAKSDRIDARVLAKLLIVSPEKLHPLSLASADVLSLQRGCKQVDWVITQVTALQNQIVAMDNALWLGGWKDVLGESFSPAARWCRDHYYDPNTVLTAQAQRIHQEWRASGIDPTDPGEWAKPLVALAEKVIAIYGCPSPHVDFAAFQAEVRLKQRWLAQFETDRKALRLKVVRPLYRQLHPERHLESLKGVGQDSAAVFFSFVGDPQRFAHGRAFRGWSGLVPRSAQSAESESKGLKISQAGPDLLKKYAFLDADVARRYDPQLAKIYYDQMVLYGKHHTQAVCAVATHLLDRILVVLQENRPYQLRDVDGTPVTPEQARRIIADKYTVPDEVRQRNNRRARRARAEAKAERQYTQREKQRGKLAGLGKRLTG
jgi:transposase